jgi:hypothetical protein
LRRHDFLTNNGEVGRYFPQFQRPTDGMMICERQLINALIPASAHNIRRSEA